VVRQTVADRCVDLHSQVDVADNSHGILVHDAIYSIARSPVFAQRHEVAI
jgi:hypothetical protein